MAFIFKTFSSNCIFFLMRLLYTSVSPHSVHSNIYRPIWKTFIISAKDLFRYCVCACIHVHSVCLSICFSSLTFHRARWLLRNPPVQCTRRRHDSDDINISIDTWDCGKINWHTTHSSFSPHTHVHYCHRWMPVPQGSLCTLCSAPRLRCACLNQPSCLLSASGKSNYGPSI